MFGKFPSRYFLRIFFSSRYRQYLWYTLYFSQTAIPKYLKFSVFIPIIFHLRKISFLVFLKKRFSFQVPSVHVVPTLFLYGFGNRNYEYLDIHTWGFAFTHNFRNLSCFSLDFVPKPTLKLLYN